MTFLGLVYVLTGLFTYGAHQYQFAKTMEHYLKKLQFKKSQTNEETLKRVLEPFSQYFLTVHISEVTSLISSIVISLIYNYEIGIICLIFSVFSLLAPTLINRLNTTTKEEDSIRYISSSLNR